MRRLLLMYGLFEPSERHLGALRPWVDEVVVARDEPSAIEAARTAEVIFGHRYLRQSLPSAERLRWVQTTAGGVDHLPCGALAARGVTLTRVTFTAPVIARHALSLAWALTRELPLAVQCQARGAWEPARRWLPLPRVAAVFGFGVIGQEIARLLLRDGIAVHGFTRSGVRSEAALELTALHPLSEAEALLPQFDWCFVAMPANPESRGWFNAARLSRLSRHAVLVNVGRGSSVVTADLCAALHAGRLGGAGLDVIEPLPAGPDDPVWGTPRLLLTPHVAAHYAERAEQMERFAEAQLARYVRGQPLENVVENALRT